MIQQNLKSDANSFTKQLIQNAMRDLNVCKVGKIESFDSTKQTAQVTLMIQAVMNNGSPVDMPLLVDVPVLVLQGSSGYLNVPIQAGDPCIVIFSDRDIDNWYSTGQKLPPQTPVLHNIKDGFVIVGFNNSKTAFTDYDTSLSLKYKQAQVGISADGKLLAKNEITSLLQVLTQMNSNIETLSNIISNIKILDPITGNYDLTPDSTTISGSAQVLTQSQQVLEKLDGLME